MSGVTCVKNKARHEDPGMVGGSAAPHRVVGAGLCIVETSAARINKEAHGPASWENCVQAEALV